MEGGAVLGGSRVKVGTKVLDPVLSPQPSVLRPPPTTLPHSL